MAPLCTDPFSSPVKRCYSFSYLAAIRGNTATRIQKADLVHLPTDKGWESLFFYSADARNHHSRLHGSDALDPGCAAFTSVAFICINKSSGNSTVARTSLTQSYLPEKFL